MNKTNKYSRYGLIDGVVCLVLLLLSIVLFTRYRFNIISNTYYIFVIISILVHFKTKKIILYKSKHKINYIFTTFGIIYIKFSQLLIILLISSYYLVEVFNTNNTFSILYIIGMNIIIQSVLTYTFFHRSYIICGNQLYYNHSYIINLEDIYRIKLDYSKIGGKSVYIYNNQHQKLKTELTTKDYEYLENKYTIKSK